MNKKYLIIGDFSTRLKFYLRSISKTLAKKQSIIILVPDLFLIPYFIRYIKYPYAILHSKMTKTQRWIEWDKIRRGDIKIVIGSQSALFAPTVNLGLIIIDQEENDTYKNDQSPRFHAISVAEKLAQISSAHLILGSLSPRVETYFKFSQGECRVLKKETKYRSEITIVDMNTEKYVISDTLEKNIDHNLRDKQKILLVLNRKGEGTKFTCADCGWISKCEKCGLPLIPRKSDNICFKCCKTFLQPESCPKCLSIHLKPVGVGTSRLKNFLNDLFPQAKIIQVEKEINSSTLSTNWDIAITTSYGLKYSFSGVGLVGIIDADQGLNFPDFSASQKTFETLYKFLRIGKTGIIQTHLPENPIIRNLSKQSYERFYLDEISQRKKFNFPPFIQLIRLTYKDLDDQKALDESKRVYNILKNSISISMPYKPFISKERNKFRYQIVIKTKKGLSGNVKNDLKNLPKGWIIDVDPINLL